MSIPSEKGFHASAWVAEQSKCRPRIEEPSTFPRARTLSGLVKADSIESTRCGRPSTGKTETQHRGKEFRGGEANPRPAGSRRIAIPVHQGPSRDRRRNVA